MMPRFRTTLVLSMLPCLATAAFGVDALGTRHAVGPTGMRPPTHRSIALRPEDAPPMLPASLPESLGRRDQAVEPASFESPSRLVETVRKRAAAPVDLPAELEPVEAQETTSIPAEAAEPTASSPSRASSRNTDDTARKLRAPSSSKPTANGNTDKASESQPLFDLSWLPESNGSLSTTGAAAALVLGLLLLTVALLKKAMPRSARPLPEDVIQLLGRVPLANKQFAQLMKVGGKLVLVAMTPDGAKPITEINDPEEVARLIGLIEQANPQGASAAFRDVFAQLADEPAKPGFLDNESSLFSPMPTIDRSQIAAAYANTPGGRANAS